MREGILANIGNTPLIRLNQVLDGINFHLYAKLEGLNPGGSIKDRPALHVLQNGIKNGTILPDTVIIESSSGNMGIGLAQVCAYFRMRFICVVDSKTTPQNILLLKAYGAEVSLVSEPDPVTGEFLQARINRVQYLLTTIENSFWPNQYSSTCNSESHYQTMREIAADLRDEVDYLFCATSTCGTLRGCAEYIRKNGLQTKIIAVDAIGSVIFGGEKKRRLIPGHGAAIVPALFEMNLAQDHILVSDLECVVGCRLLARYEAILAGGSSGAVLMAIDEVRAEIPERANCVAIFADRGERYLDTIYSDSWVQQHFGDIAYRWERNLGAELWMTLAS
jgi:cysteine synthase A